MLQLQSDSARGDLHEKQIPRTKVIDVWKNCRQVRGTDAKPACQGRAELIDAHGWHKPAAGIGAVVRIVARPCCEGWEDCSVGSRQPVKIAAMQRAAGNKVMRCPGVVG